MDVTSYFLKVTTPTLAKAMPPVCSMKYTAGSILEKINVLNIMALHHNLAQDMKIYALKFPRIWYCICRLLLDFNSELSKDSGLGCMLQDLPV